MENNNENGNEMDLMKVLIVAPSLNLGNNVSGVSAVTRFILDNNEECRYQHFLQGRSDDERGTANRVCRILKNYRKWKRLLRRTDATIIHYNFPLDTPSIIRDFFFMRKAYMQGKKMVIHIHGGLYLFKEKKPFIIKKFLNTVFSWECPFIVLSEKEKVRIQQDYHTKNVFVLPNCVDLSVAKSYTKTIASSHLDILYLGRIEPNKGMDYLYDSIKEWKNEFEDFTLHFAGIEQGNNGYIEKYQRLLGEKFVYEGVVAGEKKNELLKKCQIFILPSLYEGLPMSLLESMSFGLVPVVTDVGSIGEYVKDHENGLLIKASDIKSITDALRYLAQNHDVLQRLSKAAQQTILTHFSQHEYVSKLNHIYSL